MTVEIDFEEAYFDNLAGGLEGAAEEIVNEAAERTAYTARQVHGYTRRSGNMEDNTVALPAIGSFSNGTLVSVAAGLTPYAAFLEHRRDLAFLRPAWALVESQMSFVTDQALAKHLP